MSEDLHLDDNAQQMPLGIGDGESTEIPFSPEKPSKISPATLLLVGVFVAGMALIYTLGLHTKPRTASAAETATEAQVDSAITDLLSKTGNASEIKNMFRDADKLVAMFYKLQNGNLDGDDLQGNPFAQSAHAGVTVQNILSTSNNEAEQQEQVRKAADAFAQLRLESVMLSKNKSAAMISHKIYVVGSKLGDFTVMQIDSNRVVLSYGAAKFELKLQTKGLEGTN